MQGGILIFFFLASSLPQKMRVTKPEAVWRMPVGAWNLSAHQPPEMHNQPFLLCITQQEMVLYMLLVPKQGIGRGGEKQTMTLWHSERRVNSVV